MMRKILFLIPVLVAAAPLGAAVDGVIINGTTGQQGGSMPVTLIQLGAQGMTPLGTVTSDTAGKFHFSQSPSGGPMLLRAEFDGVTYNQMIPPGSRTGDVRVMVYERAKSGSALPEQHVMLFEPSGQQMTVNESFLYHNQSQPPLTYSDNRNGTLRFFLPAEAQGSVQVNATGPGGMPLRESAEKTDKADVYKVNFPIKPGETRIDLTYVIPYEAGMSFSGRTLYPGLTTRVAAPSGVTLEGPALQSMGQEPQTKASIFSVSPPEQFRLAISGGGRLARDEQQENSGGGDTVDVVPAAVQKQVWLILPFALVILALGFYRLYAASPQPVSEAPQPPQYTPQQARKKKRA